MIFWNLHMRQRLRRACTRVHSQFSIDGYGMSSMQMDSFCVSQLEPQFWKMALLYTSLYKQTNLTNLLSCLTLWFAWLFLK